MAEIVFKNLMENIVLDKLAELGDSIGGCHCERCRLDTASIALNHLPPKYVSSHIGEMYSKLLSVSSQHEADVVSALIMASEIVRKNPRHDI